MIDPLAVNRSLAVAEKANGSFGSDILWVFVPAAVVSLVISVWLRLRLTRRKVVPPNEQLSAYEIATLSSDERVVLAAVAFLRMQGYIDSNGRASNWFQRRVRDRLDPLTLAVFRHLHDRGRTIVTDADVVKVPLAQLRRHMAERGYLADDNFRSKVRAAVVPMAFVGSLGLVWLLVCYLTNSPMNMLGAALVLFAVPGCWVLSPVRVAPLGRATRKHAKRQFRYLRPANAPAYTTYGPAAAAMGVAVFGNAALKRLDHGLQGYLGGEVQSPFGERQRWRWRWLWRVRWLTCSTRSPSNAVGIARMTVTRKAIHSDTRILMPEPGGGSCTRSNRRMRS